MRGWGWRLALAAVAASGCSNPPPLHLETAYFPVGKVCDCVHEVMRKPTKVGSGSSSPAAAEMLLVAAGSGRASDCGDELLAWLRPPVAARPIELRPRLQARIAALGTLAAAANQWTEPAAELLLGLLADEGKPIVHHHEEKQFLGSDPSRCRGWRVAVSLDAFDRWVVGALRRGFVDKVPRPNQWPNNLGDKYADVLARLFAARYAAPPSQGAERAATGAHSASRRARLRRSRRGSAVGRRRWICCGRIWCGRSARRRGTTAGTRSPARWATACAVRRPRRRVAIRADAAWCPRATGEKNPEPIRNLRCPGGGESARQHESVPAVTFRPLDLPCAPDPEVGRCKTRFDFPGDRYVRDAGVFGRWEQHGHRRDHRQRRNDRQRGTTGGGGPRAAGDHGRRAGPQAPRDHGQRGNHGGSGRDHGRRAGRQGQSGGRGDSSGNHGRSGGPRAPQARRVEAGGGDRGSAGGADGRRRAPAAGVRATTGSAGTGGGAAAIADPCRGTALPTTGPRDARDHRACARARLPPARARCASSPFSSNGDSSGASTKMVRSGSSATKTATACSRRGIRKWAASGGNGKNATSTRGAATSSGNQCRRAALGGRTRQRRRSTQGVLTGQPTGGHESTPSTSRTGACT